MQRLLELRADLNLEDKDGRTGIHVAAQNAQDEMCDYFLKNEDVDINKCDENGISPLYHVCSNGNLEMLEKFAENKATINQDGCLHVAIDLDYIDVAKSLIKHGYDTNKVNITLYLK